MLAPILVIVFAMVASVVTAAPVSAASEKRPALTRRFVNEAPDFASTVFADSWDYGQATDLLDLPGLTHTGFTNLESKFARLVGTAAPQAHLRLLQSWNSLPNGRDGQSTPIDADRFTHASIRMRYIGQPTAWGELSWYDCGRLEASCRGAQGVRVFEGWHTYDFKIERDPTRGPVDWEGEIRGLVFTPAAPGGTVEIDWIRLYEPTNDPIVVTSRDTRPGTKLIWDRDRDPRNNTPQSPNWGVVAEGSTGTFNADAMFTGAYHFYSLHPDGSRSLVNQLKINKRPRPRVLQPDAVGGADYASVVRGNPWDFSQAGDVSFTQNMTFAIQNGELVGTNTSPNMSDSYFRVTVPPDKLIDGSRFTNFAARVYYEGDFSLSGSPGGGMNARVVWRTKDGVWRVSEDIVVYPGWNTITIDLDDTPPAELIEGGATNSMWDGQQIEVLRFDAHEDKGTRKFRVDWIKLSENDKPVNGKVTIAFRDLAWEEGTTARFYLDRDGDGVGEHEIGVRKVVSKHNVWRWTVPDAFVGTGEWYITMQVWDPRFTTSWATSKGTVEL